ncbi:MAG TPA: histidinol-phosphatase HisJ family protein [Candidatus Limnocylindrales bacterium]|jgi:histidinol-phosphatase (PHP family)|nr:histidinol-phosphatase HisJ family protein [Candidatus Limnocylindrales bacterium]
MIDRQARDLPLDAHVHTDLSPDSDVPIEAYAEAAVERGIAEIAITDHVDFVPDTPAFAYTTFEQRERVVREAAGRWADRGVAIRYGVEITWDSRYAAEIRDHLATHAYDFVIGSVHIYRGSPFAADNIAAWIAGRSLPEIVAPYFDEVTAAARSGLFDALGHIDFVKRWLTPHVTPADLAAAPELYEPILAALVESGTALEINTSGLRQAPNEAYPAPPIVARFQELGGRGVSVGSDAHRVDAFAWGLDDGYDAARAAGFDALAFRRGSASVDVPLTTGPNAIAGRSL